MEREFKIRCSQIGKIMGAMGLTESQTAKLNELTTRTKALTENMIVELAKLKQAFENPELPQTCKTYLHEWYANDNEQIHSKYMDKGNEVEDDLIDFMAVELFYGVAEKHQQSASNEWLQGSCDVLLHDAVVDVKASWNRKTLHQQAIDGLDKNYELQLLGYMHLYQRTKGVLFFGLMNTPSTEWSEEIVYEDMPSNERWLAYNVEYSEDKIQAIKERVELCRAYLLTYDALIKSKLGKLN